MMRLMAVAIGLTLGLAQVFVFNRRAAGEDTHSRSGRGLGTTWLSMTRPTAAVVHFSAGQFRMGSTAEEVLVALTQCSTETLSQRCPDFSDEQPVREISLSAFWLDALEVSVERYARCVGARRCRAIPFYQGARRFDQPDFPATMLTHADATRYCRFVGGALPTEAQFERAARGETRREYPWGDHYNSRLANHGKLALLPTEALDGFVELAPVTAFPSARTPEGVLQLAGNASEWVNDRYLPYYSDSDRNDPLGPGPNAGATERVVRGGGYRSPRSRIRGAARESAPCPTSGRGSGFSLRVRRFGVCARTALS